MANIERTKATISPTQILNLPDLEAFIKLPGNWPALKTRFKYFSQRDLSKPYIENLDLSKEEEKSLAKE